MTAAATRGQPVELEQRCAGCDRRLWLTYDAIGRERIRCPHCDGVSRIQRHPDDVLIPQGLVRAGQLPPIAPGQLRCQRCAKGVDGNVRFHPECAAAHEREVALERRERRPCGCAYPLRRGRRSKRCEVHG